MADAAVTIHVVYCPCSEAELVERLTGLIAEHVATAREGVVPALLAEELVTRLRAMRALLLATDCEAEP